MTRRSLVQLQPLQFISLCSSIGRVFDFGSKGCRFEPCQGYLYLINIDSIAQLVEQMNHNHWVGSSNLSAVINIRGCSSIGRIFALHVKGCRFKSCLLQKNIYIIYIVICKFLLKFYAIYTIKLVFNYFFNKYISN